MQVKEEKKIVKVTIKLKLFNYMSVDNMFLQQDGDSCHNKQST